MVKKFVYRNSLETGRRNWDILSRSTEIGDYVEQDEEIATIETDKVGTLFLRAGSTTFPLI